MKKGGLILLLVSSLVLVVAGVVAAAELSGTVSAVDAAKGTLTVKGEKMDAAFDCETGSVVKDVKVGDKVTVTYEEKGGKKKASKVTVAPAQKKAAVGC